MLLYIHIPFCDSKCHYCSFNSFTKNHHLKNLYVEALLKQLRYEIERFEADGFETVFIGGGTPSTLSLKSYEKIFGFLNPYLKNSKEITIEANPTAKAEWIEGIKDFATRISFGVQSFEDKKLKFLGRNHTQKEAISAIEHAFDAGFEDINLDIIYDTAIDTKELLKKDIETALSLPVNHISAYSLTKEENTPFFDKEVNSKEEFGYFIKELLERKLPQYEVSNFGKPSLHNRGYWSLKEYVGAGCGAVGFYKNRRFYPQTELSGYIKEPTNIHTENLSNEDLRTERIFLGLRSDTGVPLELVEKNRVEILLEENRVKTKKGRLYNKNFFLADEIALFLL